MIEKEQIATDEQLVKLSTEMRRANHAYGGLTYLALSVEALIDQYRALRQAEADRTKEVDSKPSRKPEQGDMVFYFTADLTHRCPAVVTSVKDRDGGVVSLFLMIETGAWFGDHHIRGISYEKPVKGWPRKRGDTWCFREDVKD